MAKNEFLPFGLADGANVLPNDEYGKLAARTNGFSSGVAKSQELNKVWRQASVIASVVAQFIAETTGRDALDDGNLAALQNGLLSALRETVSSNVPAASLNVSGITKLSNAVDSNSETQSATSRAVKSANDNANNRLEKSQNGADIPNPSEFVKNLGLAGTVDKNTSGAAQNGWWKCGDTGLMFQWGYTDNMLAESSETIKFPLEFPHRCFGGLATPSYTHASGDNSSAYFFNLNDGQHAVITCDQGAGAPDDGTYIFWWAVGI
ncbi:phage tail protein [Xenorhabdus sp. IM139775]|uniref:phage tail protein n=1 Tax=Xenorhabdus sp. IM139775 TaxID=3025876 RepID=UPI002359B617|nr:phage tail protein [Xenorhabdus sp. IM139775]MDC9593494.1 phage tail protein [Xenorhabdus sp. IM139775]